MSQRSALSVPHGSKYYLAYSKGAYQALVTFELMFQTDAARCVNPAAGVPGRALIDQRYENLKYVENAATPDDMETFWKTALNYEAAAASRPGNSEICSNGVAEELAKAAGETPPDRVDPRLIDDAKWTALREKIRADLAGQWRRDYESVRKAWEARKAYQDSKNAAAEAAKQARVSAEAAKKAADAEKQKADEEKRLLKSSSASKPRNMSKTNTTIPSPPTRQLRRWTAAASAISKDICETRRTGKTTHLYPRP